MLGTAAAENDAMEIDAMEKLKDKDGAPLPVPDWAPEGEPEWASDWQPEDGDGDLASPGYRAKGAAKSKGAKGKETGKGKERWKRNMCC